MNLLVAGLDACVAVIHEAEGGSTWTTSPLCPSSCPPHLDISPIGSYPGYQTRSSVLVSIGGDFHDVVKSVLTVDRYVLDWLGFEGSASLSTGKSGSASN